VAWTKANGAGLGGDPSRIFLIGHSAGATHVANYLLDPAFQPPAGPEVAGAVLISGLYQVGGPSNPIGPNTQSYFGEDAGQYAARSPISHIRDGVPIPLFVVITEYENPGLDVQGAKLFAALCERDRKCPRMTRLRGHNHLSEVLAFNTPDELLGRQILDFMARGH
jgi:acetyl esterase